MAEKRAGEMLLQTLKRVKRYILNRQMLQAGRNLLWNWRRAQDIRSSLALTAAGGRMSRIGRQLALDRLGTALRYGGHLGLTLTVATWWGRVRAAQAEEDLQQARSVLEARWMRQSAMQMFRALLARLFADSSRGRIQVWRRRLQEAFAQRHKTLESTLDEHRIASALRLFARQIKVKLFGQAGACFVAWHESSKAAEADKI